MLQRIISIKNVGRFKNCTAIGDVTFRRYTLIFGENARGKTTLCDILRSLFTNTPAIMIGRATLGSPGAPEVQLLTSGGNIAFRNGEWTDAYPDIAVFDGTYVKENVFAGDAVDTEHRRNLYRVIIGAQGVTLAARIDVLERKIRAKTAEIRDNRAKMQGHIPQGMTPEAFIGLAEDPGIEAKIAATEQELQAARQAAQLQQKAGLTALTVPVFPAGFAALLAKTFAKVAADAERHVNEQIVRHRMEARGKIWLTEGLQYITGDACPFCEQPIDSVGLIQDYKSFFSREYRALRDEVIVMKRQVDAAIGERIAAGFEQTVVQNAAAAESWQQYCELEVPALPGGQSVRDIMGALRESAQALLDVKAGTPLDAIPPAEGFTQTLDDFETLRTAPGYVQCGGRNGKRCHHRAKTAGASVEPKRRCKRPCPASRPANSVYAAIAGAV